MYTLRAEDPFSGTRSSTGLRCQARRVNSTLQSWTWDRAVQAPGVQSFYSDLVVMAGIYLNLTFG